MAIKYGSVVMFKDNIVRVGDRKGENLYTLITELTDSPVSELLFHDNKSGTYIDEKTARPPANHKLSEFEELEKARGIILNEETGIYEQGPPHGVALIKRGYHITKISKGKYGEISKIVEEVEELVDADRQKNPIMMLNELSDIIGAIKGYVEDKFPTLSLDDVLKMTEATERAFQNGFRG